MNPLLIYLMTKSLNHFLIIIFILSLFESLIIIRLLFPGIFLIKTLGVLIGSEELSLFLSCLSSTLGLFIGKTISYYIGIKIRKYIKKNYFFKKYKNFLKNKIINFNFIIILFGNIIGITRNFIPIISGILKIPFKKFYIPNIISCIILPPIYFLPGILIGKILNKKIIYNYKYYMNLIILFLLILFLSYIFLKIKNLNQFKNKIIKITYLIILFFLIFKFFKIILYIKKYN
ncbi:DedA family protein [Buchnera aphidicola]|uniref:DedA family protein n=1 Tax=Buchnera aphidicola TaxID=9 RepID=UPI0031B8A010